MTRLQRSRISKRRRRIFAFSLLVCMAIFITGVYITNDVMMNVLLLPEDENVFSLTNVGQVLNIKTPDIRLSEITLNIKKVGTSFINELQKLLEKIR